MEKESESEKIERLKQKIRDFNEALENLSEELTAIFTEDKEEKFHEVENPAAVYYDIYSELYTDYESIKKHRPFNLLDPLQ